MMENGRYVTEHAKQRRYVETCNCGSCRSLHGLLPVARRMKLRAYDLGQLPIEEPEPGEDNRAEQAERRADHGTGYERSEWLAYLARKR